MPPRCPSCGVVPSGPLAQHVCAPQVTATTLIDCEDEEPGATLDAPETLDGEAGEPGEPEGPSTTLPLPEGDDAEGFAGPVGLGYLEMLATQRGFPVKARVILDGLAQGESPLSLAVLPGEHLVRMERADASAELCLFVLAAGEPVHVELELKPPRR